jgi:MFS family permease
MTFPGLYIVERFGRRPALITGALWMFMCFLVFASLGHFALENDDGTSNQGVGYAMITFACLFIAGYAMTWGPIVWAVVGEIYPSRYRAKAMALATASNWTWNFLISFCKFLPLHVCRCAALLTHILSHALHHGCYRLSIWICLRRLLFPRCYSGLLLRLRISRPHPRRD